MPKLPKLHSRDDTTGSASPHDPAAPLAVILAGGLSRRMGTDKARLMLGGRSLIAHVAARLAPQVAAIAINVPARADLPDDLPQPIAPGSPAYAILPDILPDRPGPLAGVLTGLFHARDTLGVTRVLTVPVDSPFLPHDLASALSAAATGTDAIAVATSAGRRHPVASLWPVTVLDDLAAWLRSPDHRRVTDFLARHTVKDVDFMTVETSHGPVDPFFNVNTPEDLVEAERILKALGERSS